VGERRLTGYCTCRKSSAANTSAYSISYITGWANEDVTLIRSTAEPVLKTSHTIAAIIDSRA